MNQTSTFTDADGPEKPLVLLVDDDEVNLMLTAHALRERGFQITEAPSGERALELLAEMTPDIIVLDAMMPGLDGFATCHALREMAGFETVPVLMLTGLDDDASIARAYQAGATDFLSRPPSGACSPVACATSCAPRAPGSSSSAARPSWRARRTWRAWAASTGAVARAG